MSLTLVSFAAFLEAAQIIVVVLFVALWLLAARPPWVRNRTGQRKPVRQPRLPGARS